MSQTFHGIAPCTLSAWSNTYLATGASTATASFSAAIDGTQVATFGCGVARAGGAQPTDACGWIQTTADVSPYGDGLPHSLDISFTTQGLPDTIVNYVNVDDVSIDCSSVPVTLQSFEVD
ncbi:MAG: hypothetical protein ABI843_16200 [Dokdonella sp.]